VLTQLLKNGSQPLVIKKNDQISLTFRNFVDKGYGPTMNGLPVIKCDIFSVPLIIFIDDAWSIQADESMISYFEFLIERPERVEIV
jgi:hypothetical protein